MAKDVLVIGGGGREHALLWKLAQSPRAGKLYAAPGNAGTCQIAENIPLDTTDIKALARFAEKNKIDLTVVGPEDSLALGIVDEFLARDLPIFGPTRAAAKIESSKAFAKTLMQEIGMPTAPFRIFCKYDEALAYVRAHGVPLVIKASGLAQGKGVHICQTIADAQSALRNIMIARVHKSAGDEVVIEEFLGGQEISIHAVCDGKTAISFPPAQDHKPIGDGDTGDNTGGMGTVVPVPWVTQSMMQMMDTRIVSPALQTLAAYGYPFAGLLYPGVKITKNGPIVLEFNARFGDPETQSYMRLLKTDLLDLLDACVYGTLRYTTLEWHAGFAVCVVLASGGYPHEYEKNIPIDGIADAERVPGVVVFHAGTHFDNGIKTSGGRVLGVSAVGATLRDALDSAYEAIRPIRFKKMYYRRDIGAKALVVAP